MLELTPSFLRLSLVCAHICAYNKSMKIEFDPDKAAANPLNHEGVTFDEAQAVLLDLYALREKMAMQTMNLVL